MDEVCAYCGNPAKFKSLSGKFRCMEFVTQCPAIRERNSKSKKEAPFKSRVITKIRSDKGKKKVEDSELFSIGKDPQRTFLRKRYLEIIENVCVICGNPGKHMNLPLVLEIDHINGNKLDNRLENLRLLCPNCHTQTHNYKAGNFSKKAWVTDEDLLKALQEFKNVRQALMKVGLRPYGANYMRCYKLMDRGL